MLVRLTLPFYDFCGFRSVSVAVDTVYKLQFFTLLIRVSRVRDRFRIAVSGRLLVKSCSGKNLALCENAIFSVASHNGVGVTFGRDVCKVTFSYKLFQCGCVD